MPCRPLINIFGVKKGAILQNIATWAKFGAIAIFVIGGLLLGRGSWDHFRHSLVPSGNEHVSIVTGVGIALIAVFWAYDGWVYITFVGGEVKDPQRNVPRALIWGLLLVGVVYISINAVYVYALPMNEIAAQDAVAQTAAVSMFSGRVAPWLSMMVALSCFGAMAPCLMSGARVYYAMAEDGIFFHALAKVHPRWHTPVMSLVLQGIWVGILALSGKYDELFTYVMFMMVLSYVLTVAGLFVSAAQAAGYCPVPTDAPDIRGCPRFMCCWAASGRSMPPWKKEKRHWWAPQSCCWEYHFIFTGRSREKRGGAKRISAHTS